MRVVLLVTDLHPGGTPKRIARLARGLAGTGIDVHVGCLAFHGALSTELEADGIPTFACDARDAWDFVALRRLSEHVRQIRPDLIHSTLMHANVAARIVGVVQRIPVIGSTATIEVERYWHRVLERVTCGMDRAHIVNSVALAEHVVRAFGLPRGDVRIVPRSLDPWPQPVPRETARQHWGLHEREFVVAWTGRLDPVKRVEFVIHCAQILSALPCRFLLAGDGPHRPAIERALRLSGATQRVHLLGWQNDVGSLLSAADAFVFPSLTEGMPNAVLEALACGVPVVASDIPVLRDLAGDGAPIELVAGAHAHYFAAALSQLYSNPARRQELGTLAAAWARTHLDPQATLNAVVRIYQHVCHRRRP